MKLKALTVTELNKYIKKIINSDPILNNVLVKGEISNFKHHSSGHMYLTLKDESCKINCIIFREQALKLKFQASNGLKIIAKGYVSTFDRDGQYQIYINTMEPDGLGSLYLAYEQLKNKLYEEGLFDLGHKKKIPCFPLKIGVVTSPTGAAIRDIISVIKRRNKLVDVLVYPVLVQGENAASQIAAAIEQLNSPNWKVDTIIVGRGGGSIEELWAFNEEIVARSIYKSEIPVISAVGHETDFTIADLAADLRAPTPSAAAEIAVPSILEIEERLSNTKARLNNMMNKYITLSRKHLKLFNIEKMNALMDRQLKEDRHLLDTTHKEMQKIIESYMEKIKTRMLHKVAKLEVVNPLSTLNRGYAVVFHDDGKPVTSIEKVESDDHINVMLFDGVLSCNIIDVKGEGMKSGQSK
ncbi:MAG: exodeoxyribonuclease VII large subunit [Alkaliphilus sp.]|nr:exodeoxyribonuclease VII large subunit [Alkaliphilus sp.]